MAEARAERPFTVRSRTAAWALERAYVAAPLVLRLTVGPMLLAHGLNKLLGFSAAVQGFTDMGIVPASFWVGLVGLVETVGGAGLILGFFTRLSALANFVVQLVALLVVHLPNGFFVLGPGGPGFEFNLVNVGSLLALLILGGGAISVDHLIHRKTHRLETRRTPTTPAVPSTPKGTRV
ncbi:DoxX family protein [Vulgatibacter sp.]|uniref:DoxX family protein n=1 Tax=Vulgatibacter sp. TaxID=1971226 RepID=UPI003568E1E3